MEIIQEIGSYAGFAAVVGLAVLSALYFSQARDVKRLREWAGRAPERNAPPAPAAQPQRVVAQPIQRPGGPSPAVPRPPGAPAAQPQAVAAKPAAAASAGAGPAVASAGPAPATPAAAQSADGKEVQDEQDAASAEADETQVHDAAQPGASEEASAAADSTESDAATADESAETEEADAGAQDEPDGDEDTGEWTPEDEHSEYDFTDEHDAVPAKPLPPRPPQPFPRRAGATPPGRPGRGSILPPYEQARPSAEPERRSSGGRRPVVLAVAAAIGLAVLAFGAMQLTGGDSGGGDTGGLSANQPDDGSGGSSGPVDPSSVTVAVLNGTTQPGLAAQIGDQIAKEGFVRGVVTNNSDQTRAESVVLYAPGAEREAIDVSRRLDIPQREPIDAASQGLGGDATVVVIAGADQIQ
jgi:hypothetical protein